MAPSDPVHEDGSLTLAVFQRLIEVAGVEDSLPLVDD
jgi:hypothetical protein